MILEAKDLYALKIKSLLLASVSQILIIFCINVNEKAFSTKPSAYMM